MPSVELQSEYRDLPLESLVESPLNPRRNFDQDALAELSESIRTQGILSPLLVRPLGEHTYEIVAGARRYRAAQRAGLDYAPVRIVDLTEAQALETSIVENLQRRDVHPLEEAQGFAALLNLETPKYSIEQIAAKCGKQPGYVASRLKLTELAPAVAEAFAKDEIGLGHALLLAKLQPEQQQEALPSCFQEHFGGGGKSKRILLPVRHLQQWIERNILLELASAPFSKDDVQLVPAAGACVDCPKRTGFNTVLFGDMGAGQDSCTDPKCYHTKLDAHVQKTVAARPKLVQISTAYGQPKDGAAAIPRNRYVLLREGKPENKQQRDWPEYKSCKSATEAIVAEGTEKGEMRRVCANPDCPVHHPKNKQQVRAKENIAAKAEQEERRREEALAQAIALRTFKAVGEAVPVRLMKRDLGFMAERLTALLDERKLALLIRQHGIGKAKDEASAKPLAAFLRKADEGTLGRVLVETVILLSMRSAVDSDRVLREAASLYKVDVDAIAAKAKQEFAGKAKTKPAQKPSPAKAAKKASAA